MYSVRVIDATKELQRARKRLANLFTQREDLEIEIARQRRKIAAWFDLCEPQPEGGYIERGFEGPTDACRTVLRAALGKRLTVAEVQRDLERFRYLASYATISTTLKRLVDAEEVAMEKMEGEIRFGWVGPNYGASRSLANRFADMDRDKARAADIRRARGKG
jgi:hypothetical protein